MKKKLLIVGVIVLLILTLDQILKIWVKTYFTAEKIDSIDLIGSWFKLTYIENQGMAFGTKFGASLWAKLGLSIFRIIAIIGIGYYWVKRARSKVRMEFLIAIGLIFAGATGNLIDSMLYDYIFDFNPCANFNQLEGSGVFHNCGFIKTEIRHTGFLCGNVVDMFQFDFYWPNWVPWLGGSGVFPAIWNVADASISIGVVMILIRQRKYFPKPQKENPKTEAPIGDATVSVDAPESSTHQAGE